MRSNTAAADRAGRPRRPRSERLARAALTALWVLTGVYACSVLKVPRPETGYTTLWEGWVANIIYVSTAVLIVVRGLRSPTGRAGFIWLGSGVAINAVAGLVYLFYDQNQDPIPWPGPADVFYLLTYVALAVGVVLLTRRGGGSAASVRLDGVIVALGLAAAAAPFVLQPALAVTGDAWEAAVGLAYPLGDLILLILLLAGVLASGHKPSLSTLWLAAGALTFAGGDIAYLGTVADGTYVAGTLMDVTWIVGVMCFASAAWERTTGLETRRATPPRVLSFLPVVGATIAIVVPAMQIFVDVPPSAMALAVVTIAVVLVRLAFSLREVGRLLIASRQARTDELTTLPNRRGFFEQLDQSLAAGPELSVLLFDLDGFKDVNDTLGHAAGDELLQGLSGRVSCRMPPGTHFARLGGDEFAAILPIGNETAAFQVATEMTAWFHEPVVVEGVPVRVGASCGISLAPLHGTARSDLLRAADVAMYQAKRIRTGGVVVYESAADPNDRDRLQLIEEFRDALARREFVLHYQPLVSFEDGVATAVEALVRWPHPTRGFLPPLSFIPMAEQAGLLPRLTRIVVDEAVAFAASFGDTPGSLAVSVNVSAQDLLDDALHDVVTDALTRHGLDGSRLTLEITEAAVVRDPERARRLLEPLRALGVRVALDDFGTGYQSLAQVLDLDIDEVKLDRSLVADVAENPKSQAVVRAMAALAGSLGIDLVAEGIETRAALERLRELGCTTAQGFLLARPVPGDALAGELRRIEADRLAAPSLPLRRLAG